MLFLTYRPFFFGNSWRELRSRLEGDHLKVDSSLHPKGHFSLDYCTPNPSRFESNYSVVPSCNRAFLRNRNAIVELRIE